MMDEPLFTGTIAFVKAYSTQRWPKIHTIIYAVKVYGGNIRVWIGPEQRMTAVFKPDEGNPFYAQSAPIEFVDDPWEMIVVIRWNANMGDIWINGQMAGSSNPAGDIVEIAQVGRPPYWDKYRKMFSEHSPYIQSCVDKRRHEVAARRQQKGQRPVRREEYRNRLKAASHQIRYITGLINKGHEYFDTALSDRIRALVCRFERGPSYPLLQHVAGTEGASLLVYGMPFSGTNTDCSLASGLQGWIIGPLSVQKCHPLLIQMDLDEWLDQEQASCNGIDYTNNKMLRAIADTYGTHYDATVEPMVDFLQRMAINADQKSIMIHKLIEIGQVVVSLCDKILEMEKRDIS